MKGAAKEEKARKRLEAETRNAEYQSLSLDERMARNSAKVRRKLVSQ